MSKDWKGEDPVHWRRSLSTCPHVSSFGPRPTEQMRRWRWTNCPTSASPTSPSQAIASRWEAIAIRLEAIVALRLEAIAIRLEAIASRWEALGEYAIDFCPDVTRFAGLGRHRRGTWKPVPLGDARTHFTAESQSWLCMLFGVTSVWHQ